MVLTATVGAALPDELAWASEEILRALLTPEFVARLGWDEAAGTFTPDRDDVLLGLLQCAVPSCSGWVSHRGLRVCQRCARRHSLSGLEWPAFLALPSQGRPPIDPDCAVEGCPRPGAGLESLCRTHSSHRREHQSLPFATWLTLPAVHPLSALGPCLVTACPRKAALVTQHLCEAHHERWVRAHQQQPDLALEQWAQAEPSIPRVQVTVLHALPKRVQLELLVALQQRTAKGRRTSPSALRALVAALHTRRVRSLLDLPLLPGGGMRHDASRLARTLSKDLYCALSDPERERRRDHWNLAVFGLPGSLDFTAIRQRWLRETAKAWASEDLHLRRGTEPASTCRQVVVALTWLSESLQHSAQGRGEDPRMLGRGDIVAFCNRMAHAERAAQVSNDSRLRLLRCARKVLDDARQLGLTRADGPAAGLPGDFCLRRGDIPGAATKDTPGRDLPAHIVRTIADNLHVLEQRCGISERRITEILIDTGRRPDEVCTLAWDCLTSDASGQPVLIYDDRKNNRPGRRLPIARETAAVITAQKQHVKDRFPATPVDRLALFPCDAGNRDGSKPIRATSYGTCVAYAYRHTYAQRHADAGVPPDVLRELMGHRSLRTTAGYYRISARRLRAAVDKVARHQFNGAAAPVFHQAAALLADDRTRIAVGQVAVPFGICTEPSNVKAAGRACPFKYTCIGCGHFRSDPSYLPELKSYLQQLLADRERFAAATELTDWARHHLTPPEEQIDQLREMIRRIEADLGRLSDTDRTQIEHAITAVRRTRQTVDLGMPALKSPRSQDR